MIKNKQARKTIAIFFLLNFLSTLMPYNALYAQSAGPNAPEAGAFEPVDATDMVNLVTGDFTYVLPLLNVPSPEGGYPIGLSYHAGIAMDQEASWVGLGWSLNPGVINRAVNGTPDDHGKTQVDEFFQNKGWTEDFYSISVGIGISGVKSIALGLSWGTNKSLSGSVSFSIGGASVSIGDRGVNGGVSLGLGANTSFNFSTEGVASIIKGFSIGNVDIAGNFSTNSGGSLIMSNRSIGMSLSSNSFSLSSGRGYSGAGVGVSNVSSSVTSNDYDIKASSNGFSLDLFVFNIGYNHTQIDYSLFKRNRMNTSGILKPIEANETEQIIAGGPITMKNSSFMDVHHLRRFEDRGEQQKNKVVYEIDFGSLVLPSYDNYNLSAQGISGSFKPSLNTELNLSGKVVKSSTRLTNSIRESKYYNHDSSEFYKSAPLPEVNINAITKKNFNFTDSNNGFFRLDKVQTEETLKNFGSKGFISSTELLKYFKTKESGRFTNDLGIKEDVRREGKKIEYYTNNEIRTGNVLGFIEAKSKDGYLSRSNTEIFLPEGIGGFKITAYDGKTYHYSLPVYNFETYYKSFKTKNNENDNFIETEKRDPYATHWLLTAITGSDYVDVNGNNSLDKDDYGYWVEFEYGKWSDGYGWRFPKEGFEEIDHINANSVEKSYSYTKGRKQIYYLDAVKTRTHTALFIKEVRKDGESHEISDFKSRAPYDDILRKFSLNSELHSSEITTDDINTYDNNSPYDMYTSNGDSHTLDINTTKLSYKKVRSIYRDVPTNYSLRLKEIILVNNKDYGYDSRLKENDYKSSRWREHGIGSIFNTRYGINDIYHSGYIYYHTQKLYWDQIKGSSFEYNTGRNVLDVFDFENIELLRNKALKIIDFKYDYSLAKSNYESDSGKLTLKGIQFKGKSGKGITPSYKFDYYGKGIVYNRNKTDDWGYYDQIPQVWSLNKIITPLGTVIDLEYESDTFYAESAVSEEVEFRREDFSNVSLEYISKFFKVGRYYRIRRVDNDNNKEDNTMLLLKAIERYDYINGVQLQWELPEGTFFEVLNGQSQTSYYYGEHDDYTITLNDLNGKKAGGLRVKKITISDSSGNGLSTKYNYNDKNGKTSGITSYSPTKKQRTVPYYSLLPSPMVTYANVTMKNYDSNNEFLGSTEYNFETLKPRDLKDGCIFSLGNLLKIKEERYLGKYRAFEYENFSTGFETFKYTIEDRFSSIGRLNNLTKKNKYGEILSNLKYNYLEDLDFDNQIGVKQESYSSFQCFKGTRQSSAILTSKINYPSIVKSITETQSIHTTSKYFDKYDFLTGGVLETRVYNSNGKAFKTKVIPAYYKYSAMGSKVDNIDNKNMLSQTAAEYSYILKNNEWKKIGVGITTWKNNWEYQFNDRTIETTNNVWRKHKTYTWNGAKNDDGTLNYVDDFNWTVGTSQNSNWKELSEVTRYNQFSQPIEVKDVNESFASTKMGDDYSKVIATANANYNEMHYSGAEYTNGNYFDGGIKSLGYKKVTDAHTGVGIVEINQGQNGFEVTVPSRTTRKPSENRFKVSVWVRKGQENSASIKLDGATYSFNMSEKITAGSWVLLTGYVNLSSNSNHIVAITSTSGTIQLDDFRLHPAVSNMMSYVYNEWDEVSYIIGANGLATRYIYDDAGRLIETQVETVDGSKNGLNFGGFEKVSTNSYNYKLNNQ